MTINFIYLFFSHFLFSAAMLAKRAVPDAALRAHTHVRRLQASAINTHCDQHVSGWAELFLSTVMIKKKKKPPCTIFNTKTLPFLDLQIRRLDKWLPRRLDKKKKKRRRRRREEVESSRGYKCQQQKGQVSLVSYQRPDGTEACSLP